MAADVFFQQGERFLRVETRFGPDVLKLVSLTGHEGISRLFRFRLKMLSEERDLDPLAILGQPITFSIVRSDTDRRHFHGIVKYFGSVLSDPAGLRAYEAEVVPSLWLLTKTTDCRIFQHKTFPQVIEEILEENAISSFSIKKLMGEHPTREYIVQYRESDFSFISRLMEEEGIYYYFRHSASDHQLIISDNVVDYDVCAERSVPYEHWRPDWDGVRTWSRGHAFVSGRTSRRDYNFETPHADMEAVDTSLVRLTGNADLDLFDYPGRYKVRQPDGDALTRVHMEEEETTHTEVSGTSRCRSFTAGAKFSIPNIESESGRTYVLTGVAHEAVDGGYRTPAGPDAEDAAEPPRYANSFTCMPAEVPFRPPRSTPKAVVQGPQTAVVTGPPGEEIHTDPYGRIRVQFHWDRRGTHDDKSSCWIRVAQPWAGHHWGAMHLPRVGHEVVVAFLEGDPDRPLVVGSVYNAAMMPPWDLPANKTQTGLLTRSSPGGSSANFNELRFEDRTGTEQVYFHAERNFDRVVENDDTLFVGNDQTITVDNNRTELVQHGNESVTVAEGDRTVQIASGTDRLDVAQSISVDAGTSISTSAGTSIDTWAGNTITIEAGDLITLKVGMSSLTLDPSSITLNVGASTIRLDPANITTTSVLVSTETMAKLNLNAGANTTLSAGGVTIVKGGIVKIN